MLTEYPLNLFENVPPVILKYIEAHYPLTDTSVMIYDAYKLNIMLSDGLAAVMNDRNDVYNTFSGDLLFFAPTEIHHGRILRQGTHKYMEFLIPVEYFPTDSAFHALFQGTENLLCPPIQERAAILSLAEQLTEGIRCSAHTSDIDLWSELLALLKICKDLSLQKKNLNQNMPATLQNAISFIRKEYAENIQVSHMASAVNCSASYLSRTFKKHMGKSPYGYLTEYRLFVAEKLLRSGETVTDSAAMAGFCDSSVFIKCFKKSFGMTPLKYKKLHEKP